MAAHIAPSKAEALSGADIVLIATDKILLNLSMADTTITSIPEGCSAQVQLKTSPGGYVTVATLDARNPSILLEGPGTYIVKKRASGDYSFGVDKT